MHGLWLRPETKFEFWLRVELAILKAREITGDVPEGTHEAVAASAAFTVARIDVIEREVDHDVIAFVKNVQEELAAAGAGDHASQFHRKITSYDVVDPALILTLRRAVELDIEALATLERTLMERAREHQWSWMIMRSHGQYAEPSTFGHLLLVFTYEIQRCRRRLQAILDSELKEGKVSGAVGSYAGMNTRVEVLALAELGLRPALAETQILQRDRHATLLSAIAVTGGVIEQIAKTLWVMARSDVREIQEPRKKQQRGSSAMAHKKNPIKLEQLMGLPRLLRGYANAAIENVGTFEAREISQSSVERHILGGATGLLHYMLGKLTWVIEGMDVHVDRMRTHLEVDSLGVWAGQRIRNALMEAGVSYDDAYLFVQSASFAAVEGELHLREVLFRVPLSETDERTAMAIIDAAVIEAAFDHEAYARDGIVHMFTGTA